jgi:pimeloyl-ACP methyl ester carboxylesterase
MMPNELEAHRRTAATEIGEISYLDVGEGPTALFVHGIFTNAFFWRNVLAAVRSQRRCIAIDMPAHGQTRTTDSWDLSLGAWRRRWPRCAMPSTRGESTSSPTTPAGPWPRSSPPPTHTGCAASR